MKNQLHSQWWVSQQTKIIPTETETPVPIILPILIYLGYGLLSLCILTLNLNSPLSCCTSSGARSGAQGSRVATRRAYIGNKSSLQWNQTLKYLLLTRIFYCIHARISASDGDHWTHMLYLPCSWNSNNGSTKFFSVSLCVACLHEFCCYLQTKR